MRIEFIQKILDKIRNKKQNFSDTVRNNDNFPIQLSKNEQEFLISYIKNSNYYLEFGSGGSTFLALLKTKIENVTSVESDKNWIEYLREWGIIKENEACKNLKFIPVDIGKTGAWGAPLELEENKHLFQNYSQAPFYINKNYDLVFIDGRFRVACTLQTILNCDKNTKIIIHDFNNRPEYHKILEFLDIIDTMDTMAVFHIKDNINQNRLLELYEEYKNIYL